MKKQKLQKKHEQKGSKRQFILVFSTPLDFEFQIEINFQQLKCRNIVQLRRICVFDFLKSKMSKYVCFPFCHGSVIDFLSWIGVMDFRFNEFVDFIIGFGISHSLG